MNHQPEPPAHESNLNQDPLNPLPSNPSRSEQVGQYASGKRVLCIWLPNWPIQRLQAAEPQLADRPLALINRDARRGLIVTAANLPARAAGVRSQMRLAEASALVDLETRQHQTDEDIEALCSLAEQAQGFSPLVGIEQLDRRVWAGRWLHQPESLLLDVTGLSHLFGGYENLLMQAGGWLRQQRYFGCLAIANSVGSAWALANFALRGTPQTSLTPHKNIETQTQLENKNKAEKSIERQNTITSGSNAAITPGDTQDKNDTKAEPPMKLPEVPPSRYLVVEPAEQARMLEPLPLAALRIDETTHTTLKRLGLRTLKQLFQLPRAGLANRLGQQLLDRWDQLTGACDEPIIALHGSPDWSVDQELEIATDHVETIVELVRRGIDKLAKGLERRGEGAVRVVCRLDLVEHVPLILQIGMFRPTCDAVHLNLLAASLLEQQLPKRMKAPLWRLAVQATLTAPLVWRQGDLFSEREAASRQEIAHLVDTLSARLGRKQVLRAKSMRESQPELAYDLQPLTGLRPDGGSQDTVRKISSRQPTGTVEPSREDPLRRPAQLLNPPTKIEVAGTFGVTESLPQANAESPDPQATAPARIKTANGWHRVLGAVGPERLESGWWKGQSARRDYYRIITHLGCWWWIYRDLNSGEWFLHGIFD